jgi:hypothetical protein
MSYQPIEDYGIIGNMRTVAQVGMNVRSTGAATHTLIRRVFSERSWMTKMEADFKFPPMLMACDTSSFIGLPRTCWLPASCFPTESPN